MTTVDVLNSIDQVSVGIAGAGIALITAFVFYYSVHKFPVGSAALAELQGQIQTGAIAFLSEESRRMAMFVAVIGAALAVILIQEDNKEFGVWTMICFVVGALFSALAGWIGMYVATSANARTTTACKKDLASGLQVAFASGAVMSFTVIGLGLGGLTILYLAFEEEENVFNYLSGFGFGASSIALFARVAGGVFTKAADVGADLVGKTEARIPEDDPRNPAVIADNVGDNVGDVAGMGADLFESYVGSIIATITLASDLGDSLADGDAQLAADITKNAIGLPFWIAGGGVLASLIGVMYIRGSKLDASSTLDDLLKKLRNGIAISGTLMIGVTIFACVVLFERPASWKLFGCVMIGLVSGVIVGTFTEYCTSYEEAPTRDIAAASFYGPAPVVIKGMGVGMLSVVVPTVVLGSVIVSCNFLVGLYGISLAAVGMLSTLGITLATDAYGPVADNAGGIAEMAGLPSEVRQRTDLLDSLGNTTAATGKGFAIGSAVLTSVGLLVAFMQEAGLDNVAIDLREPVVLAGLLIGAMLPFVFAALTMLSVDKSARAIIAEVRYQFAAAPELLKGARQQTITVDGRQMTFPDAARCVTIASNAAIQEMILPGTLAVFTPAIVGFLLGTLGLAGLLGGSLTSGFSLALFMANSGGAWDNAKKWVEKCGAEGEPVDGVNVYYNFGIKPKGSTVATSAAFDELSDAQLFKPSELTSNPMRRPTVLQDLMKKYEDTHSAAVTGDTIGDPFKDTSGPALNILIKLMSVVSLVLAPAFKSLDQPQTGFGEWGVIISILVICILTLALAMGMRYMQVQNEEEEAIKSLHAERVFASIRDDGAAGAHVAETKAEEPQRASV